MKKLSILSLLLMFLSFNLYSQDQFNNLDIDSVAYSKNNELFERIVNQRLMNFPFKTLFPAPSEILNMMMILSSDGYFGYSGSRYLNLTNGWHNVMKLRDLDGNSSEIEINADGNNYFFDENDYSISSFQKTTQSFVIKDEDGEHYDVKTGWVNLESISSESGYQITFEKIKKGYKIYDNQNNSVEIKKSKSYNYIASYSNGRIKESIGKFLSSNRSIFEDGQEILSFSYDTSLNYYIIKDNKGMNLTINNSFILTPVDHHHSTTKKQDK